MNTLKVVAANSTSKAFGKNASNPTSLAAWRMKTQSACATPARKRRRFSKTKRFSPSFRKHSVRASPSDKRSGFKKHSSTVSTQSSIPPGRSISSGAAAAVASADSAAAAASAPEALETSEASSFFQPPNMDELFFLLRPGVAPSPAEVPLTASSFRSICVFIRSRQAASFPSAQDAAALVSPHTSSKSRSVSVVASSATRGSLAGPALPRFRTALPKSVHMPPPPGALASAPMARHAVARTPPSFACGFSPSPSPTSTRVNNRPAAARVSRRSGRATRPGFEPPPVPT